MDKFIRVNGSRLELDGAPIALRGVNFGNWLLLEHFMIGLPYVEAGMHDAMVRILGQDVHDEFFRRYQDAYITEDDFKFLSTMGANFIRLPFHFRIFLADEVSERLDPRGFELFDRVVSWCVKYGLYVMFDLHAAPGTQALDWNADNIGEGARFWTDRRNWEITARLWKEIARRYRDERAVMGYDLVNEPQSAADESVNGFYRRAIREIRAVDTNHLIVLEANDWCKRPASLDRDLFDDPGVMYQPHFYAQQFFPFGALASYPCVADGKTADRAAVRDALFTVVDASIGRPALFGEFGLRYTGALPGQLAMYDDVIDIMNTEGFHWSVWTYKDIGTSGMGFVRPRAETPWRKFTDREDISVMREKFREAYGFKSFHYKIESEMFDRLKTIFDNVDDDTIFRAMREARRDLERIELVSVINRLKEYPASEIVAMADSFHFRNCEVVPEGKRMLERGLARK